jgi:hypothetical protein
MIELLQTYGVWLAFIAVVGLTVWAFASMGGTGHSQEGCCASGKAGGERAGDATKRHGSHD